MTRHNATDVCRQVSLLTLIPPDELKPNGRDKYKWRCSFHDDQNASAVVNLHKGQWLFRCFACGVNGGVIDYVMLRDRVDFLTALDMLSTGLAPSLPATERRDYGEREPKAFLLACDGAGCTAREWLDAGDLAFAGETLHTSWQRRGASWFCGRCLMRGNFANGGQEIAA